MISTCSRIGIMLVLVATGRVAVAWETSDRYKRYGRFRIEAFDNLLRVASLKVAQNRGRVDRPINARQRDPADQVDRSRQAKPCPSIGSTRVSRSRQTLPKPFFDLRASSHRSN